MFWQAIRPRMQKERRLRMCQRRLYLNYIYFNIC